MINWAKVKEIVNNMPEEHLQYNIAVLDSEMCEFFQIKLLKEVKEAEEPDDLDFLDPGQYYFVF
jgi:hypothetical protein